MMILDRIEENTAFIEGDEGMFTVEASKLSPSAREGDVLLLQDDGSYLPDPIATAQRRERIKNRLSRLNRLK